MKLPNQALQSTWKGCFLQLEYGQFSRLAFTVKLRRLDSTGWPEFLEKVWP